MGSWDASNNSRPLSKRHRLNSGMGKLFIPEDIIMHSICLYLVLTIFNVKVILKDKF